MRGGLDSSTTKFYQAGKTSPGASSAKNCHRYHTAPLIIRICIFSGLLNKTLDAWRSRMRQDGSAAGQMGGNPSVRQAGAAGAVVQEGSDTPTDEFKVTGTSKFTAYYRNIER